MGALLVERAQAEDEQALARPCDPHVEGADIGVVVLGPRVARIDLLAVPRPAPVGRVGFKRQSA